MKSNSQHSLAKPTISSVSPLAMPLTVDVLEHVSIKTTTNDHQSKNCCPCCCKSNKICIKYQTNSANKENKSKFFLKNQSQKQQQNLLSSVSSNRLTSILCSDNKNLLSQNTKNTTTFQPTNCRPFSWTGITFTQSLHSPTKNNKKFNNKSTPTANTLLFDTSPPGIQNKNINNKDINKSFITKNSNLKFEISPTLSLYENSMLKNVAKGDIKTSQSLNFNNSTITDTNDKTVIQASTSELLNGLGHFIELKCKKICHFESTHVALWMRTVDRALMVQVNNF